jgi:hypothetical protein
MSRYAGKVKMRKGEFLSRSSSLQVALSGVSTAQDQSPIWAADIPNLHLLEATRAERDSHVLEASGLEGMGMILCAGCADASFGCYLSVLAEYHAAKLFENIVPKVGSKAIP